jgi:D-glycero-D-manno-heptose 1,7-bisphosphate phosphatase
MKRLVVVDRDGTLNEERHRLSSPEQVALLPGAAAALRSFRDLGFSIAVVTNQSVVARGQVDVAGLARIHQRLQTLLQAGGAWVDAFYYCPHLPGAGCPCRKPGTALLEQAAADFDVRLEEAFVIGDQATDIEMGRRAGATTLLVQTGYGHSTLSASVVTPAYVVPDLVAAAAVIGTIARDLRPAYSL